MHRHRTILTLAFLVSAITAPALAIASHGSPGGDRQQVNAATAFGTAITYQGRLVDAGAPANGVYDLRFLAYDAEVGGTQFGAVVTKEDVVVTNGLFTTLLDFGADAFKGDQRWVEMAVKPGTGGSFTVLSPRQPVGAVPYALYAKEAGLALPFSASAATTSVTGIFSLTQTDAGVGVGVRRTYAGSVESPAILGSNSGPGAALQGESSAASGVAVLGAAAGATGIGGKFSGKTGLKATGVGEGATALEVENGAIKVSGTVRSAFVHKATAANSATNYTVIDNVLTNGDPNAILIVTKVYNPGGGAGVFHNYNVAVQYLGATAPEAHRNKWAIYNEEVPLTAIALNAAFNVLVIKQ